MSPTGWPGKEKCSSGRSRASVILYLPEDATASLDTRSVLDKIKGD